MVIALITKPITNVLEKIKFKKIELSEGMISFLAILIVWSVIFVVLSFYIPVLTNEILYLSKLDTSKIIENLNGPISKIESLLIDYKIDLRSNNSIKQMVTEKLMYYFDISYFTSTINFVVSILGNIFIALFSITFITFFLIKDRGIVTTTLLLIFPNNQKPHLINIVKSVKSLLYRYFSGIMLEIFLVFILSAIGLALVGVDFGRAVFISSLVSILNIIPYIGPLIGMLLGVFLGIIPELSNNSFYNIIPLASLILIVFMIIHLIDNIIFQPLIYSNSVKAHPLEIFLVIMISGTFIGIIGMIIAVPIYTVLRVIAKEYLNHKKIFQKLTEDL